MKVFQDISRWQRWRRDLSRQTLGFVPTMGALHAGHGSLVEASKSINDTTVVSIFVNPTQFDNDADLQAYPVAVEKDLEKLKHWGVQAVLLPAYESIYPDRFRYRVSENELSRRWCGAHRPGHFEGMLTVVMRLLNLVQPDRAYFGEKDYQQLLLIRGMVEAFFMPVEIIGCPTVREDDGLARSSRNRRLDADQREQASQLNRILLEAGDVTSARQGLEKSGFQVEYVDDHQGRRLAAAYLGDVRLIDNVRIAKEQGGRP